MLEKEVKIRIDDDVYKYLDRNGADINKIMQIFANQLNYYLNERLSIYKYLQEIRTSDVFYAIAEEIKRLEEKNEEDESNDSKGE